MHHLSSKKAMTLLMICGLSGCASIVGGTHQHLSVEARSGGQSVQGANCTVTNNRGTQSVTTPGTVTVRRDSSPLDVQCVKDGAPVGSQMTYATVRGMVWGNILFGGLIGLIVDFGNGAAHHYPNMISVMLNAPSSHGYSYISPSVPSPISYSQPQNSPQVDLASLDGRISASMFNAAQNVAARRQCDRAIRVLMADGQRALFESTCPTTAALQIECTGASCKAMHPEG